ncbi:MAG: hypothetical protein WBD27_01535 [Pyrinomonadaceae bacterium]
MKVKILVLLCLSILAVIPALAQTKSVTNSDLEKFRQKRLQAEKDYRENYSKMGFPSPEELDRQIEKSRVEREALATRLTSERLQRDQAEAAARAEAARLSEPNYYIISADRSGTGYLYGYPNYYYYRRSYPRRMPYFPQFRIGNGVPTTPYPIPTSPFEPSIRFPRR